MHTENTTFAVPLERLFLALPAMATLPMTMLAPFGTGRKCSSSKLTLSSAIRRWGRLHAPPSSAAGSCARTLTAPLPHCPRQYHAWFAHGSRMDRAWFAHGLRMVSPGPQSNSDDAVQLCGQVRPHTLRHERAQHRIKKGSELRARADRVGAPAARFWCSAAHISAFAALIAADSGADQQPRRTANQGRSPGSGKTRGAAHS